MGAHLYAMEKSPDENSWISVRYHSNWRVAYASLFEIVDGGQGSFRFSTLYLLENDEIYGHTKVIKNTDEEYATISEPLSPNVKSLLERKAREHAQNARLKALSK